MLFRGKKINKLLIIKPMKGIAVKKRLHRLYFKNTGQYTMVSFSFTKNTIDIYQYI